jgi:hypothetical protein
VVPSNAASTTAPSNAPPPVLTVPMIAAAIPATCGTGCIAAVFAFGSSTELPSSTNEVHARNTTKGGLPSVAMEINANSPVPPTASSDARRTSRCSPMRPTMRAFTSEPAPMTMARSPKNTGKRSPWPKTSSMMISELAM